MRSFVLSRQKFPFTTLFIGIFLGLFVVLDPFITNIIACKIELTIPILNKNIFKLYPYELSTLLFLFFLLLLFIRRFLNWVTTETEKAFIILFMVATQTVALHKFG